MSERFKFLLMLGIFGVCFYLQKRLKERFRVAYETI